VNVEKWAFVAPYLIILLSENASQLGPLAAPVAMQHIQLVVVKLPQPNAASCCCRVRLRGRSLAWAMRYQRLAHDYEQPTTTLVGLYFLTLRRLMLHQCALLLSSL